MAGVLKIFYSSGSALTNEFSKDTSESIGGIITSTEIVGGLNNLFRSISLKMLSDGVKEYRIVFLKNVGDAEITDLQFYHKVPATTNELDPANLVGLQDGDEYIVPSGATGDWLDQDGKKATYILATTSWEFDYASFASYDFGFISPVDIVLDNTTLVGSFVDTLDYQFSQPAGITFVTADDVDGSSMVTIGSGTLDADAMLAMVIRRTVAKQVLSNDLFPCPTDGEFNPDTIFVDDQYEDIIFSYEDTPAP